MRKYHWKKVGNFVEKVFYFLRYTQSRDIRNLEIMAFTQSKSVNTLARACLKIEF